MFSNPFFRSLSGNAVARYTTAIFASGAVAMGVTSFASPASNITVSNAATLGIANQVNPSSVDTNFQYPKGKAPSSSSSSPSSKTPEGSTNAKNAVNIDPMKPPSESERIGWPLDSHDVTSPFGPRQDPVDGGDNFHTGVDFSETCGGNIYAADDGEVIFANFVTDGYGNRTVIKHSDRMGGKEFFTTYNHQAEILVHAGDHVKRGDVIGHEGTTGHSTGCHVHFETILGGFFVDPMPWLTGEPSTVNQAVPVMDLYGPMGGYPNGSGSGDGSGDGSQSGAPTGNDLKNAIRYCESSNNYRAQNPSSTASGAYQFLDSTWQGIPVSITGGTSRAKDATVAQQDAAFDWLFAQQGTSPWVSSEHCWGHLTNPPTAKSGTDTPNSPSSAPSTETGSGSSDSKSPSNPASSPAQSGKGGNPTPGPIPVPQPSSDAPAPSTSAVPEPSSTPTQLPSSTPSCKPSSTPSKDPTAHPTQSTTCDTPTATADPVSTPSGK